MQAVKAVIGPERLFSDLIKTLGSPRRFRPRYKSEAAFENDVWKVVRKACKRHFSSSSLSELVLTSHTRHQGPAERRAWRKFLHSKLGPDVLTVGSKNRLDIVVRHPQRRGSIGIEVKCLGRKGHAPKLTQGLGQTMLARAHRTFTLLLIHCGTVRRRQRSELRAIARRICRGAPTQIIVVP